MTAATDSHVSTAPISASAEPFDRSDINDFRADDKEAGSNIGKLLIAFFCYSLLAMAFVTWWAFAAMQDNQAEPTASAEADHAGH